MTTSEQINELATALATAQAEMGNAVKDSTNPHFKSKYADLASVRAAIAPMSKHGLSVVQSCRLGATEGGQMVAEVETRLLHKSGQWMADTLAVPVSKPDAQGIGSALTYGRRYSLAAFAGIAPEDDDGQAGVGNAVPPVAVLVPEGFFDWWADFQATADNGSEALKDAWGKSDKGYRNYATTAKRQELATLKERARQADGAAS